MPRRHGPGASATSLLAHVEEVVLATSGEDAFEVVMAVAAARLLFPRKSLRDGIAASVARSPELALQTTAPADLLARVDGLLRTALEDPDLQALDAVFEAIVSRVAKGDKGQFFTPRHVVEFVVRALAPKGSDVVVDPACGSGAFLAHARKAARVKTFGCDVDPRAVRVARLFALASGRGSSSIVRADGLRESPFPAPSVVATNPPFAGRAAADGFEVASVVRTPERDVLFLERALVLLRPGGRLGIVLPYNKAAGPSFAGLRRWLFGRARIFAVVGLPRETFLPHTAQRTFVLFAKKRRAREVPEPRERVMFLLSERAGKDSAGRPVLARGALDHDLGDVLSALVPFLDAEGFA